VSANRLNERVGAGGAGVEIQRRHAQSYPKAGSVYGEDVAKVQESRYQIKRIQPSGQSPGYNAYSFAVGCDAAQGHINH
jgi:hypothetical protein